METQGHRFYSDKFEDMFRLYTHANDTMVLITVSLSRPQLLKLEKGLVIRASADQLQDGDVELDVSEEQARKIASAVRRGKGCQIYANHVDGGSLKSIRRSFKKAGKSANKFFTKAGNKFADEAPGILEKGKKYVPKGVIKQLASAAVVAGATAIGQPQLAAAANTAVLAGIDAGYSTKFDERGFGKKFAKNYSQAVVTNGLEQGVKAYLKPVKPVTGAGLSRRPAKGSQEAKDFMAALRARKGQKSAVSVGEGFRPTGEGFRPTGEGFRPTGSGFLPHGSGLQGGAVKGQVLSMAHEIERRAVANSHVAALDSKGGQFISRNTGSFYGKGFLQA